jgi:hypothetical protein
MVGFLPHSFHPDWRFSVTLSGLHPGSEQGISPRHNGGSARCTRLRNFVPSRFGPSLLSPGGSDRVNGTAVRGWLTTTRLDRGFCPIDTESTEALSGDNCSESVASSRIIQCECFVAFLLVLPFRLWSELKDGGSCSKNNDILVHRERRDAFLESR